MLFIMLIKVILFPVLFWLACVAVGIFVIVYGVLHDEERLKRESKAERETRKQLSG